MRFKKTGLGAAVCMLALCGCQSWNTGYPIQSPSRVPPPGTGSFQSSSPYYNGGGSVSQNYPAAAPGYGVPPNYGAPVQSAAFTAPANQPSAVVPATQFSPTNNSGFGSGTVNNQIPRGGSSANFSDGSSNFRWQN